MLNLLKSFFAFLSRLYGIVVSLVFLTFLGAATFILWESYLEANESMQFHKEGKLTPVVVEKISRQELTWKDHLTNSVYLQFHYRQQAYITRFVIDTVYISEKDTVSLLYHPQKNAFLQSDTKELLRFSNFPDTSSKLIRWSVISTFTGINQLLAACLFVSIFFIMLLLGAVSLITGWNLPNQISGVIGSIALIAASLFFTYDAWQYYQYYRHIQTNGEEHKVKVIDTDRISGKRSVLYYTAHVEFNNQQRLIAISEDDYYDYKPGESMYVLYDITLDDMIPEDYSIDYWHFLIPVLFWVLSFFYFRRKKGKKQLNPKPLRANIN